MVLLGEAKPGHTLQLVEVMLNPFAQEAHRIGSATIPQGETWYPNDDYAQLLEVPCLRGCFIGSGSVITQVIAGVTEGLRPASYGVPC
jgi:hypothetical protein